MRSRPRGERRHPFGTIKSWMGATHFQMRTLKKVGTEMALHVLAYNLKRVMSILGIGPLIAAIRPHRPASALIYADIRPHRSTEPENPPISGYWRQIPGIRQSRHGGEQQPETACLL